MNERVHLIFKWKLNIWFVCISLYTQQKLKKTTQNRHCFLSFQPICSCLHWFSDWFSVLLWEFWKKKYILRQILSSNIHLMGLGKNLILSFIWHLSFLFWSNLSVALWECCVREGGESFFNTVLHRPPNALELDSFGNICFNSLQNIHLSLLYGKFRKRTLYLSSKNIYLSSKTFLYPMLWSQRPPLTSCMTLIKLLEKKNCLRKSELLLKEF